MSNFSSIFAGVSGLNANAAELSVVGNNIANENTVAFKSSRTTFGDLVNDALGGRGDAQNGGGVKVAGVQLNFSQGPLGASTNPMDWAIDGNGFFVVKDTAGSSFYTRAG